MPQDYNIYLRSLDTSGQSDPTRPWSQGGDSQPTSVWNTEDGNIDKQINMASNPVQTLSGGINDILRKYVKVAVAFSVLKTLVNTTAATINFVAETMDRQSGNFGYVHGINNIKRGWRNITRPFSTAIEIAVESDKRRIENERRTLNIALLGDTMMNRGV